jgi:hypothetical protein
MRILVSGATATVRRLAGQHRDHLGVLMTPHDGQRVLGITLPWAADNAAFSNPDDHKFWRLCCEGWGMTRHNPPLWVAVPDVVGDHAATLRLFGWWLDYWREELGAIPFPLAFVLQDGCQASEVPWDKIEAVFVGGSTGFKLRRSAEIVAEAKQRGKLIHVGRVNTLRRLRFAHDIGADTVDGTAFSMFPDTHLPKALRFLQRLEGQRTLF